MSLLRAIHGSLTGRIALLDITDPGPSLSFKLHVPVWFRGEASTLTADLRHPETSGWRGLVGRTYRFDDTTQRFAKSDGTTYAVQDVYGDLRTDTGSHDTSIAEVMFGSEADGFVAVGVTGSVRVDGDDAPFSVRSWARIGPVVAENVASEAADSLLDPADYERTLSDDGQLVFEPRT